MMGVLLRKIREAINLRRPSHRAVIQADREGRLHPIRSVHEHLDGAMGWLSRAQRSTSDHGVSAGYGMARARWSPSYPETTGYIIPTFFDFARHTGESRWRLRARDAGEFLLRIQQPAGSFPGGWIGQNRDASVFNSGQIVKGLCRLYQETQEGKYRDAARRAVQWLIAVQDPDGAWRQHTYQGQVHSYYTMVGWAVHEMQAIEPEPRLRAAVENHGAWAVRQQQSNGWFQHASFDEVTAPFTHTIGYALQGLLEMGIGLGREDWVRAVEKSSDVLMNVCDGQGRLAGQYDSEWRPVGDSSCLTGNGQIACVWLKLADVLGRKDMGEAAVRTLRYVVSTQDLESRNDAIRGGIKGSHPVWGDYQTYTYPNWAAKFLSDALMMLLKSGRTIL